MRALLRLLLLALLVGFLVHAVRRALAAARESGPRDPRASRGSLPPDKLVCGACGQEFDPEQNGWICPKCGK